jgi:hypothetical protein
MNRFSLPTVSRYYARRRTPRPAAGGPGPRGPADSEEREPAPGVDEGDQGE